MEGRNERTIEGRNEGRKERGEKRGRRGGKERVRDSRIKGVRV
jgi:hypothetical protein